MRIIVKELVGANALTLSDGQALYEQIHPRLLAGDIVNLDFAGVETFASPFFNAGVGQLLADLQPNTLNELVKFQNLPGLGQRILRRVINNAKEYYSVGEEQRRAIDRIVREVAETL